ncbi:nucleotide exchange factor GrpE [Histidinibacterium aquaticum]|uniref:Protein GrpE n=1 Tax=Histidinibacterium aquaticum TaxID=2613962 RepID=A0A5J5GF88_9RHOB|nr:nucleotide exchange factor GrpE [Histidinibacterium aquaticum]KAA9006835.1 nucleotide exchange factor GrpE [Histidinibacterium aquaticum]
MAKPKSEQEFMDEVAAELRGDAEPSDVQPDEYDAAEDEAIEPETQPQSGSDELEALRAERDEMKDRFVRALAEAENVRKRADRDRREAEHYGGSKLARDMLPVYDNLERALQTANEESREVSKALLEGVELTMKELVNVFKKHGIEPVQPEVGDKFDPQYHQAMFEAPVPNTTAGEIIQVAATGFMLHDRLLRPAQVGVSSTPAS